VHRLSAEIDYPALAAARYDAEPSFTFTGGSLVWLPRELAIGNGSVAGGRTGGGAT
jgi:hypothetical protein